MVENSARYKDNTSGEKHPGAYKQGIKILGLMRDLQTWKLSEILAVWRAKLFSETINNEEYEKIQINDDNKIT